MRLSKGQIKTIEQAVALYNEAGRSKRVASELLNRVVQPRFDKLREAKDIDGIMKLIDELPKNASCTRLMYEAIYRIQDETRKPTADFTKLYHADQYRVIQTLSNEFIASRKEGQGCRAGLYLRNINTALRLMDLIGEWIMLKKISDRAVAAMYNDEDAGLIGEIFHEVLAVIGIKPIELMDSYFQHEDKLKGEVWLTRDREYWDKH